MLSISGEIILCDVVVAWRLFFLFIYLRSRGWVAFLSYFWLEMWGSGAGKWEGSGKI